MKAQLFSYPAPEMLFKPTDFLYFIRLQKICCYQLQFSNSLLFYFSGSCLFIVVTICAKLSLQPHGLSYKNRAL